MLRLLKIEVLARGEDHAAVLRLDQEFGRVNPRRQLHPCGHTTLRINADRFRGKCCSAAPRSTPSLCSYSLRVRLSNLFSQPPRPSSSSTACPRRLVCKSARCLAARRRSITRREATIQPTRSPGKPTLEKLLR